LLLAEDTTAGNVKVPNGKLRRELVQENRFREGIVKKKLAIR